MTPLERTTKETRITVELGKGNQAKTPDKFLSHMIESFGKHSGVGVKITCASLDDIDHHYIEDSAIAIGRALRALTQDQPIQRFGQRTIPMDDALVAAALDAGGRPYFEGQLPVKIYEHFLRSLAFEAGWTLHLEVIRGRDEHHVVEAAVKAVALALRDALEPAAEVASTKGKVELRGG